MPGMNRSLSEVGIGFASFLAPPGPDVIRFTVGQPDFDTPIPVVNAAKAALDRGETTYTRTQGQKNSVKRSQLIWRCMESMRTLSMC